WRIRAGLGQSPFALHGPAHATARHRRQPRPRILPPRLRRRAAACAGTWREPDDRHRRLARGQRTRAGAGACASRRAVGQTGLDYNRNYSPRDVQLAVFERQLAIAAELGKPLFLHQRDAHADFVALLRRWRDKVPAAVVHCFTDSREALADYLALDCHVGITGWICDERRGSHLRELVREIPADRLMIETDAP